MAKLTYKDLLDAGVHFGHLTRKWDPHMAPYIFMERNGIHIVDLNKTLACLEEASNAVKNIVRSGRKIMFVATKKQAKGVVEEEALRLKMPYVTERWLGGMLTNFTTIRKSLKKLSSIEKLMKDESYQNLAKRERLMIAREKDKLENVLGGISDLTRLPAAVFVVDIKKENIAVKEAQKLNIPIIAIVDTNSNPNDVDFPIPGNDDAFKSIDIIVRHIAKSVEEGLMERKKDKEDQKLQEEEEAKRRMDEGKEEMDEKPRREAKTEEKKSGEEVKVEKGPPKDQKESGKEEEVKEPDTKKEKEETKKEIKEEKPSVEAETDKKEEKKVEKPSSEADKEEKEKSESREETKEKA